MSKKEFLEKLRVALNGRVSPVTVEENVRYYEDYINTEIRKGRSEEEVLQMLGDPRLLARTIIQTSGNVREDDTVHYAGGNRQWENQTSSHYQESTKVFGMPRWLAVTITVLLVFAFFYIVFSILSFLAPVIIVVVAVVFLVKLFRDWLD